ncbi:MAG: hypothetical protein ABI597_08920 [Gammaproteobacteria bacterium]
MFGKKSTSPDRSKTLLDQVQQAKQETNQFLDSLVEKLGLLKPAAEQIVEEVEFKSLSFIDSLKQEFANLASLIKSESGLKNYRTHIQEFKNFVSRVETAKKKPSSLILSLSTYENSSAISAYKMMLDQACKTALEARELTMITHCSDMFAEALTAHKKTSFDKGPSEIDKIQKAKMLAQARIQVLEKRVALKEKAVAAITDDDLKKSKAKIEVLAALTMLSDATNNDQYKHKSYTDDDYKNAASELARSVYRRPAELGNMQDADRGAVFDWHPKL